MSSNRCFRQKCNCTSSMPLAACWRYATSTRRAIINGKDLVRAVADVTQRAKERQEREEFLRFQSEELGKAQLVPGEDEALVREHRKLQNSGRLLEIVNQAYDLLYDNQASILSQLTEARKLVHELGTIDDNVKNWNESIDGGIAQVEELVLATRNYKDGFDHDPARLAQIDERLALLQRLKKKYRESLEDLLARQIRIQSELDELANIEERTQDLQQQVSQACQDAWALGQKLSEARQAVAQKLEKRIAAELAHLMMDKSRFHVGLTTASQVEQAGPHGLDQIEFTFCANPGESLQPLGAGGIRRGTLPADVGDENGIGECGSSAGADFR